MTVHSALASPRATLEVLDQWGLFAKKSLGQNFLIDDSVIGRILDLSAVGPRIPVVEVGPGIGTLTVGMLAAGAQVWAIEKDPDLPAVLAQTTARDSERFHLLRGDALRVMPGQLPSEPWQLVSNLPYAVAATIVLDWFQRMDAMQSATVMVQAEVAERMKAHHGCKDYGAYTVKLALQARAVDDFPVSRNCFLPAPHVDSTVIRLERRNPDELMSLLPAADRQALSARLSAMLPTVLPAESSAAPSAVQPSVHEGQATILDELVTETSFIADAAFCQRRKTIRNSMRSHYATHGRDMKRVDDLLECAGIEPGIRGETLSVPEFLHLGVSSMRLQGSSKGLRLGPPVVQRTMIPASRYLGH